MSHVTTSRPPNIAPLYKRWRIQIFAVTWIAYAGFYFTRQAFSVAKLGILEDPILSTTLTKSTLANLLIRARQGEGEIRLGDRRSAEVPLGAWRRRIVVVPHEIDIFTGSVAENIALPKPDAGREEIAMAATLAGLADDIAGLPDGYDTRLGQDGVELSAGQK